MGSLDVLINYDIGIVSPAYKIFEFNKFLKLITVSKVNGTASISILNYFGLLETEKELFMAIVPDYLSHEILYKLKELKGRDNNEQWYKNLYSRYNR